MEAAHKNTQTMKGLEPTVGTVVKITQAPKHATCQKPAVPRGEKPNCYRCCRTGHLPHVCGFNEAICRNCRRRGHIYSWGVSFFQDCVPERWFQTVNEMEFYTVCRKSGTEEEQFVHYIGSTATPPYEVKLTVNNKCVIMEVDTGAAVSLNSHKTYQKFFASVPLEKYLHC